MKRVLILCHDFPPLQSAAALRTSSWLQYLPEFGFYPIVIARKWAEGIRSQEDKFQGSGQNDFQKNASSEVHLIHPKKSKRDAHIEKYGLEKGVIYRRWLSFVARLVSITSREKGSNDYLYQYVREFLQSNKVDLIIASGGPFELFKYASILSEEFGIPWIADYRDEMKKNHSMELQSLPNQLLMRLEGSKEKFWTRNASMITTVSGPLALRIADSTGKPAHVIRNGTELLDVPLLNETNREFLILYTGTIYNSTYIDFLDKALQSFFKEDRHNVKLRFIGTDLNRTQGSIKLKSRMAKYGDLIEFLPAAEHKDILVEISRASVCLNLVPGSMASGIYPVKLYDYLSMSKPVINVETEQSKMQHDFTDYTIDVHDELGLLRSLQELYASWTAGKTLENKIPDDIKKSFERKYQCGILAKRIEEVISNINRIEH